MGRLFKIKEDGGFKMKDFYETLARSYVDMKKRFVVEKDPEKGSRLIVFNKALDIESEYKSGLRDKS